MTNVEVYEALSNGGGYSLPYLLTIKNEDESIELNLINDNKDFVYNGIVFKSSAFNYSPSFDGDSSLEIEIVQSDYLIDIIEGSYTLNVTLVGILSEDNEVYEFATNKHHFGEGTWDGSSLKLSLKKDDRLDMTFPACVFNNYNNRGNA